MQKRKIIYTRLTITVISISLLLLQCKPAVTHRDFFSGTNGYPDFTLIKANMPVWGLDSLAIDSISTPIEGKDYWYMSAATDGLLNINGYIRRSNQVVYIKAGDRDKGKTAKEQTLFDFSPGSAKSWLVKYERNQTTYLLRLTPDQRFFNKLVNDTVIAFKAVAEMEGTSLSKEFLLQSSLEKGLVSFLYLDRADKRIYTIDYLPAPAIKYENITTPVFPTE